MRNYTLSFVILSLLQIGACGQEAAPTADTVAEAAPEMATQEMPAAEATAAESPATLGEQLDARKNRFLEMAPPERIEAVTTAIAEIATSGILERAIKKGDRAPDFTLPNAIRETVSLYAELEKGPVILAWYRGSWCPYCNLQLHDYQKSLDTIAAAGAQLMAVSPELPDSALTWKEKEELEFAVLSDLGNQVARDYGIVFRIPDAIAAGYVAGGRNDLTEYNGDDSLELPLAVTYVIDSDGTVVYSFVDADYRKRAETSDVVAAVVQLAGN